MKRIKGMVTRAILTKGYAFVAGEDEREYFFHVGSLDVEEDWVRVHKGAWIEFEPAEISPGRWRTAKVTLC